MKKLCLLLFVCAMLCIAPEFSSASEAQQTVAIMWVGKASMPNDVMLGFMRKKKDLAPNLEVVIHREIEDMKIAEKMFREFETSANGIIFLRSNGAEFLAKANPKIPCFVGATNNPAEIGVVKNMAAPEGNVTGVTYDIPVSKRFQVIKALFPNVKSIALITEKGYPGGVIDEKATSEECQRLGIQYNDLARATVDEIMDGMQKLVGKVDLFILANNRLALDNATKFSKISLTAKIPMFAYSDRSVNNGAVAALVARNEVLGNMLAESVVDVVVKGTPISKVPVKTDPDPAIMINETTMKALGINFSPEIMAKAKIVK